MAKWERHRSGPKSEIQRRLEVGQRGRAFPGKEEVGRSTKRRGQR